MSWKINKLVSLICEICILMSLTACSSHGKKNPFYFDRANWTFCENLCVEFFSTAISLVLASRRTTSDINWDISCYRDKSGPQVPKKGSKRSAITKSFMISPFWWVIQDIVHMKTWTPFCILIEQTGHSENLCVWVLHCCQIFGGGEQENHIRHKNGTDATAGDKLGPPDIQRVVQREVSHWVMNHQVIWWDLHSDESNNTYSSSHEKFPHFIW